MPEAPTDAELLAALADALGAAGIDLAGRTLAMATTLDGDVGLDSFQLMQVARHLERRYGYAFSVADWVLGQDAADAPDWTAGALVRFMADALGG
jgi:hypothetical protein